MANLHHFISVFPYERETFFDDVDKGARAVAADSLRFLKMENKSMSCNGQFDKNFFKKDLEASENLILALTQQALSSMEVVFNDQKTYCALVFCCLF
jgi:hypothetical protein